MLYGGIAASELKFANVPETLYGTANFSGIGSLSADSSISNQNQIQIGANFAGSGLFSISAALSNPMWQGSAAYVGAGSLSVNAKLPPMFVNNGSLAGWAAAVSSTASAPPGLPASRANGNLLVAWVQAFAAGLTITLSSSPGWTIVNGPTTDGGSIAIAWRYVDGNEAIPTFQWTGGTAPFHARIIQLMNAGGANPIGDVNTNSGSATPLAVSGITTSAYASMALGLLFISASDQVIPNPSNYTSSDAYNDSFGDHRTCYERLTSAAASDDISVTITNANWQAMLVEILS